MTTPFGGGDDLQFQDLGGIPSGADQIPLEPGLEELAPPPRPTTPYPDPILSGITKEKKDELKIWLDEWLERLISDNQKKQTTWALIEEAYRAEAEPSKTIPFDGASTEVVPAVASAVDPVFARLDTGIFKQDPVFKLKGLKKSILDFIPSLEWWVDFYQRHMLKLRQVSAPRIIECTKLGTCAFKTVYSREEATYKTYDDQWNVTDVKMTTFKGPRVFGLSIGDLLFPPAYQHLQDCPIVAERQRTTYGMLKVAEASGRLANVDEIKNQETHERTDLERAREESAQHTSTRQEDYLIVYECWFDFDINGDGIPERMVATYHKETQTFLQLRYNWYFHQRKPYTVIPYSVANDTLYGTGIGEMAMPFQEALTKWQQMASDNAYLANIRMFIAKTNSGIEEVPRLYSGRVFFVDDPKNDFLPFAAAEIYPSTLTERQNLVGLLEKRSGVSDYLTGRESPIIGSRATATSTLALIQEGTKRVEEVLENFREGFSEILQNCFYIWIQYGPEGLEDTVFGDSKIGAEVKLFFDSVKRENVNGAIAIDLSATDAQGNRQAQQQMQLAVIQVMMQYLEKLLEAGAAALQAQQTMPEFSSMVSEVMTAARMMFKDLLNKYDVRNPDDYLPDLEKFLDAAIQRQTAGGSAQGLLGGPGVNGGLPADAGAGAGAAAPGASAFGGLGGV